MIKKKPVILLILSVLILFSVTICYTYPVIIDFFKKEDIPPIEVTVNPVDIPHGAISGNDSGTHAATSTVSPDVITSARANLAVSTALLPVKNISQLPELPTGCEITSLTIALNYLGFSVDKEYMAATYLDKAEPLKGSFDEYFIGSPWDFFSWGCYSTVITRSAQNFLRDHNSPLHAYNLSGSSLETLCGEVAAGNPVIIWGSQNINDAAVAEAVLLDDGTTTNWYSNEHCMVLIGYDLAKSTVTVCDPLNGVVEYDFNTFALRYEELQKMGVVIK